MLLDLIDPESSEVKYRRFGFPDGQPSIEFTGTLAPKQVEIVGRITNPVELLELLLVADVLSAYEVPVIHLYITYLMAGRSDRRETAVRVPYTLPIVTALIRAAFPSTPISLLDPHSDVSVALLDARVIKPYPLVARALLSEPGGSVLIAPDAGAAKRVDHLGELYGVAVVQCLKRRDPSTGVLSDFHVLGNVIGKGCLIVDDICDGGRTFIELAKRLRRDGARSVALCVTHGIFSNGADLSGIDRIYTTDSYRSDFLSRELSRFQVCSYRSMMP